MMDVKTTIQKRRSCRSFDASPLSEDQLMAILMAGRWAPSPLNLQPFEFIVVTDNEAKARVRMAAEAARHEVIDKGGPGWVRSYETAFLEGAPVLVVVVVDPSKGGVGNYFGQNHGSLLAGAACVQNMILAATAMGIGSLWFTFFRPETLKSALNIPDKLAIVAVIPFGIPAKPIKTTPRRKPPIHHQVYVSTE